MTTFSNETSLNVKHQRSIFQHIVQIHLNTYWHTPARPYERCDCCWSCKTLCLQKMRNRIMFLTGCFQH